MRAGGNAPAVGESMMSGKSMFRRLPEKQDVGR